MLKSRWVLPERLEAAGFVFAHPDFEGALRDCVDRLSATRHRVAG